VIQIVGGVYFEHCLRPAWHQLFGSAGRAAAILADAADVELHTYVDPQWRRDVEARALAFGFALHAHECPFSISFHYAHPLAIPLISPPLHKIDQQPTLDVHGSVVLRFGMLECDAKISGDRVVYDPQSATNPRPFHANGSTAEHLAIVANVNEATLLTGERDTQAAAQALLRHHKAEVVIIKQGPHGAAVVTAAGSTNVPAYQSEFVFSIGSGDVFAAAFTLFWGEQKLLPPQAAELASRVTALYCGSRALPPQELDAAQLLALPLKKASLAPGQVYLAGPFFTLPQRWLVEEARNHLLAMGLDVFSPIHDVGAGGNEVAEADLEGLGKCDRVLALVDGGDVGTVFEVGYARSTGLFVVALAEAVAGEDLKMIQGSGCVVVNDFVSSIYRTVWKA
jgi:hypothetical protein